jgi:hypothetical protein
MRGRVVFLTWLGVTACGQAASMMDGGVDSGTDATTDATIDVTAKDASSDASTDVFAEASDASSYLDVDSVGSCESDSGWFCFDYVGDAWTPTLAATICNPDAGDTLVWAAACPTSGRTGSCVVSGGSYEFVERCYPPFSTQQCDGLCLIFDGGFYPN